MVPYDEAEARQLEEGEGWCSVLVMGGDMLVYASGGVLPATVLFHTHRIVQLKPD